MRKLLAIAVFLSALIASAQTSAAPATLPRLLSQFRAEPDRASKELILNQITTKFPEAGPELLVLAEGPDEGDTNWLAIRGIGYLKFSGAIPFLEKSLNSKTVFVRSNAARSLGEIGDASAIGPLMTALPKEQDGGVIEQTALALQMLHAKRAIPILKTKIENPSPQTRIWTLGAVEFLGGRAELPFIASSLQDPDIGVRAYAAESMQRLSGQNFGFPSGTGVHVFDEESGINNAQRWWSNHKREWEK
jgi:HEAT repeat protein